VTTPKASAAGAGRLRRERCVGPAQRVFRHVALLYGDADAFLGRTLGFVRAGLEAGEPTLVVLRGDKLAALRAELGDPEGLFTADMAVTGANPARIIPAWRDFLDRYGGGDRAVRGVGEPVWAGRSPAEVAECQIHEALLNRAFGCDRGFELMCPYDARRLDPSLLEAARHSHAFLDTGEGPSPCQEFDRDSGSAAVFEAPLPEAVGPVEECLFGLFELAALRRYVVQTTAAAGYGPRSEEIALAVHEAAANSVRHGGGRGLLRSWTEGQSLLFEVSNRGRVVDPLVGRVAPVTDEPTGRGVWLMNQVCDLVQVRNTPRGVVVRLHVTPPV